MVIATDSYARQDAGDVAAGLNVDPNAGLTSSEAAQRLANYGYNEIEEREEPLWHRILRRFWGPIPWMIEVASILSAVARKWEDFVIITIMLVVNAGIDFAQERRAMSAIAALKKRLAGTATVIREVSIPTLVVKPKGAGRDLLDMLLGQES